MSPPDDSDTATIYVEVSEKEYNAIPSIKLGNPTLFESLKLSCFTKRCYIHYLKMNFQGKRNMVDGFVRWCQKGSQKVGLSQVLEVVEAVDEVPTGLYDGFYVKIESED